MDLHEAKLACSSGPEARDRLVSQHPAQSAAQMDRMRPAQHHRHLADAIGTERKDIAN